MLNSDSNVQVLHAGYLYLGLDTVDSVLGSHKSSKICLI